MIATKLSLTLRQHVCVAAVSFISCHFPIVSDPPACEVISVSVLIQSRLGGVLREARGYISGLLATAARGHAESSASPEDWITPVLHCVSK